MSRGIIRLRTNGKVNLFLRVAGKRPDGYHEIETILQTIDLGDDMTIEETSTGRVDIDMEVLDRPAGALPQREENLIWHACRALLDRGATNDGVAIKVAKRIPVGSGLGGGSANAAGVLLALSDLWQIDFGLEGLSRVGAEIGSDVPFAIRGGTALATSRGEDLTALPAPRGLCFVLGISDEPLLTRDVYAAWEEPPSNRGVPSASMAMALGGGDAREIASLLHNDLEAPAFKLRPELGRKKRLMQDAGALGASLSGSGPTIYAIASGEAHGHAIAAAVKRHFDRVLVVASHPECVQRLA